MMKREMALMGALLIWPIVALADNRPTPLTLNNPFAFELDGSHPSESGIRIVREGSSSPFTQAHPTEQAAYMALYTLNYLGRGGYRSSNDGSNKEVKLPQSTDRDGHPLWFDGYQGRVDLTNFLRDVLVTKRYDVVDRLFKDWSDPAEMFADGQPKLKTFIYIPDIHDDNWEATKNTLDDWRRRFPKSSAAALAEVSFWYTFAWNARGSGLASAVSPEGWKLYRERLGNATRVLRESKSYAGSSSLWSYYYLKVHQDLDFSKRYELETFFREIKAHDDFWLLYEDMAFQAVPKWGGSWDLLENIARVAILRTHDKLGYSYYTRIYWDIVLGEADPNIFHYSKASWPDIKRGFDDMMRLYPHSAHNLNKYAAMACMADDKETYETVRFKLGKQVNPQVWPSGYSLDLCDYKFPTQKL